MDRCFLGKKYVWAVLSLVLLSTLILPSTGHGFVIGVNVSPYIVNIQTQGEGHNVRVVTSVAYYRVAEASAFVNGVPIPSWKSSDGDGRLVVRFTVEDLAALPGLVREGNNTVRIEGTTRDAELFAGESSVYVTDGKKRKTSGSSLD